MLRGIFLGGQQGQWQVVSMQTQRGEPLPAVPYIQHAVESNTWQSQGFLWCLQGVTSNIRYTNHAEQAYLLQHQPPLQRSEATLAALIPIRKTAEWWDLAQEERRMIFEEQSHHIAIGITAFPAVARRLYHGHDLGEPFDFLTWFEYAPVHAKLFEQLVDQLRATEEWQYVEREIDIRLRFISAR